MTATLELETSSIDGVTMGGMPVVKRSVSFEPRLAASIQSEADADGVSFSAWLSGVAEHAIRIREGLRGVAEWEADNHGGPLTAEEHAEGEAWLDDIRRRNARVWQDGDHDDAA